MNKNLKKEQELIEECFKNLGTKTDIGKIYYLWQKILAFQSNIFIQCFFDIDHLPSYQSGGSKKILIQKTSENGFLELDSDGKPKKEHLFLEQVLNFTFREPKKQEELKKIGTKKYAEYCQNHNLKKMTYEEFMEINWDWNAIKELERERNKKEYTEKDVIRIVGYVRHFVEHLDELVLETDDQALLQGFWEMIFEEYPTLETLKSGTLKISPIIRLKEELESNKNVLAAPGGIEPPLPE